MGRVWGPKSCTRTREALTSAARNAGGRFLRRANFVGIRSRTPLDAVALTTPNPLSHIWAANNKSLRTFVGRTKRAIRAIDRVVTVRAAHWPTQGHVLPSNSTQQDAVAEIASCGNTLSHLAAYSTELHGISRKECYATQKPTPLLRLHEFLRL
jgi:hypothetical protein